MEETIQVSTRIFADRQRTNMLRASEQQLIHLLLKHVPAWLSPNAMTAIGMFGSIVVFTAFLLAANLAQHYLLLGILGLIINWIGDSLDGRLAYYRNIARKWYGFALDITMDWLSIILIGLGYYFYASGPAKILAFLFVVFYGWSMLIALLRFKIADVYRIDSGLLGPTELRLIIALILVIEYILPGTITYLGITTTIILFIINTVDTNKLLKNGNERDWQERKA